MKINYSIGDVFKVKLKSNEFALGVVVRANFKGVFLGYFFKSSKNLVLKDGLVQLSLDKIVFRCLLGDLGLIKKKWSIIGKVSQDDEIFKLPILGFYRLDDDDKYYVSKYDQDLEFISEKKQVKFKISEKYIEDSIYGFGLVEEVLKDL